MLPGGLLVLGVFIITTLELADDLQNALRRVSLIDISRIFFFKTGD